MNLPNLTKHFKLSLGMLALIAALLFALWRWLDVRIKGYAGRIERSSTGDIRPSPSVLPNKDKEKVSFNEKTHTLTVQTTTKTITEYAHNPVVEIRKDGSVSVSRHLAGFELAPFLGGGYADTGRLFIGANVFHFSRFDISGSLSWTPDNRYAAVQPFLAIGYNFYNNTSINVGVAPLSLVGSKGVEIGGFVSVRL